MRVVWGRRKKMRVGRCLGGEGMAKCEGWSAGMEECLGMEKEVGEIWDRGLWDLIPPPLPHTCIPYLGLHLPTPSEFLHSTHLFTHFDVCEELRDRIWGQRRYVWRRRHGMGDVVGIGMSGGCR